MRHTFSELFMRAALPALLLAAPAISRAAPAVQAGAMADDLGAKLGWLQGCWAPEGAGGPDRGSVEQWTGAAGNVMLGMARTIKGGALRSFEFMQLREDQPGKLTFIAQPNGKPPTTFTLLRQSETEFVFQNPGHDFPQRVIYRRKGDTALHARVEGTVKGKLEGIDFPMTRVRCEGS